MTDDLQLRSGEGFGVATRGSARVIRASSREQLLGERGRLSEFVALMKPRVMMLAVFTALVGMAIAPGRLALLPGLVAIGAIAAGAGAAGVLNMWYDADIDGIMTRTARRPIPRGMVAPREALVLGLILAVASVAALAVTTNIAAAGLLAFAIFFYVVVYTIWLKRRTPQNIVIGGAAGALPPVIGWAAATGTIGLEPVLLFLVIFLWTPPHFWALALNRSDDYARAGVPMLPVVAGAAATTRQILIYSVLLAAVSVLPWAFGLAGALYGTTSVVSGAIFVVLAWQLRATKTEGRRAAHRLFAFSILYLFALFGALLASPGSRSGFERTPQAAWTTTGGAHADALLAAVSTARSFIATRQDEV